MFFKNLIIFQLNPAFKLEAEEFNRLLEVRQARICGSTESFHYGWCKPLGETGKQFLHGIGKDWLFCLQKHERHIPVDVLREFTNEKIEEIKSKEQRHIGRKERSQIKEDVLTTLLPKAFVRQSVTWAWLAKDQNLLVIDTGTAGKAEMLSTQLRKTVGALPAVYLHSKTPIIDRMTRWVESSEPLPEGFSLSDECVLIEPDEKVGGVVRAQKMDLTSDQVKTHISEGMKIKSLTLSWRDKLLFTLHDDLSVKRLRYSDELLEALDKDQEDQSARFDADFALMSGTLKQFFSELFRVL